MCPFLEKIQEVKDIICMEKSLMYPVLSQIAIKNLSDISERILVNDIFHQIDQETTNFLQENLQKSFDNFDFNNIDVTMDGVKDDLIEQIKNIKPEFHTEIFDDSISFKLNINDFNIYKFVDTMRESYCEIGQLNHEDSKNSFYDYLNIGNNMNLERSRDQKGPARTDGLIGKVNSLKEEVSNITNYTCMTHDNCDAEEQIEDFDGSSSEPVIMLLGHAINFEPKFHIASFARLDVEQSDNWYIDQEVLVPAAELDHKDDAVVEHTICPCNDESSCVDNAALDFSFNL